MEKKILTPQDQFSVGETLYYWAGVAKGLITALLSALVKILSEAQLRHHQSISDTHVHIVPVFSPHYMLLYLLQQALACVGSDD